MPWVPGFYVTCDSRTTCDIRAKRGATYLSAMGVTFVTFVIDAIGAMVAMGVMNVSPLARQPWMP